MKENFQNNKIPLKVWVGVILLFSVFILLFHWKFLISSEEKGLYYSGDFYFEHYPSRAALSHVIVDGRLPLWNPYTLCGWPLLANFQSGSLYPFSLLWAMINPSEPASYFWWHWNIWFHYLLAALGMFLLLRKWKNNLWGAILGGLAYSLCGFHVEHVGHIGMFNSLVWLPWILFALDKTARVSSNKWLGISIIFFVVSTLGGHWQMSFYIGLVSLLYLFVALQKYGSSLDQKLKIPFLFIFLSGGTIGSSGSPKPRTD